MVLSALTPRGKAFVFRSGMIAAFIGAAFGVSGCDDSTGNGADRMARSRTVSRSQYGNDWPLSVDRGELRCYPNLGGAVAFAASGTLYALNDAARRHGYVAIRPIRTTEMGPPGLKDLGPLLRDGASLCHQPEGYVPTDG
jgi:hypothetical protein